MGSLDLEKVRKVWREVPDADVASALRHPEDYPPEVVAIIEREAEARELDPDAPEFAAAPEADMARRFVAGPWRILRPTGLRVHRFLRAHRLLGAVCVGIGVWVCGWCLPPPPILAVWLVEAILLVALYLAGLVWNCWPLRDYRTVIQITAVAWASNAACGVANSVPSFTTFPVRTWLIVYASHFVAICAIPSVLLCGAVYLRNTRWPVYPPGHCAKCGYDLRGLPVPRCPECWTPFDPAKLAEAEGSAG